MIICEYFFKQFHSRGSNEYLNAWASEVDEMADQGWRVLDCCRESRAPGLWTVVFGRPADEFLPLRVEDDQEEDCV